METKIFEYNLYNKTKEDFIEEIFNKKDKLNIISGNPEVLDNGLKDNFILRNFTSENSVIIPDGIGLVIASKIVRQPVREKIAGIEVMEEILKRCALENKPVYFLGAKQETLESCISKLQIKYPKLKIAGSHNGYFEIENCKDVLKDINETNPYAIFVAMGSPKQELFIIKYMEELPAAIFMGVGGSFDIFAGNLKRAPRWMINLGMEWLYRVIKEPVRIKRLSVIPKFILKVFVNKYIIK